MVAPVPLAHLSFIEAMAVFSPRSLFLKMMIFASWPPSSMTLPTSGCRCSTASDTALTSCTNLPPVGPHKGPEPEPVRNIRQSPVFIPGNAPAMVSSIESTYSGCFVWWRW